MTSMSGLTIRNIDEQIMQKLRARAAKHRRSVEGEVCEIIETALQYSFENDPQFREAVLKDAAISRTRRGPKRGPGSTKSL